MPDDRPVVERFDAADHFQQSGFAGAVAADQTGAFLGRDQPVQVFKKQFMSEALASAGELQHSVNYFL